MTNNDVARMLLFERTGSRTVPQVFLEEKFLGGCSDVLAMDESGELDILIKGEDDAKSFE